VSFATCETSIDLRRIDINAFLRDALARRFLRDTQCKTNGEGRREEVTIAMSVIPAVSVELRLVTDTSTARADPRARVAISVSGPDGVRKTSQSG